MRGRPRSASETSPDGIGSRSLAAGQRVLTAAVTRQPARVASLPNAPGNTTFPTSLPGRQGQRGRGSLLLALTPGAAVAGLQHVLACAVCPGSFPSAPGRPRTRWLQPRRAAASASPPAARLSAAEFQVPRSLGLPLPVHALNPAVAWLGGIRRKSVLPIRGGGRAARRGEGAAPGLQQALLLLSPS